MGGCNERTDARGKSQGPRVQDVAGFGMVGHNESNLLEFEFLGGWEGEGTDHSVQHAA